MRRIGLADGVRGACLAAALASCGPLPSSPEPTSFRPATPSVTIEPAPAALRVAQTAPAEGDTLRLDEAIRVRFSQSSDRSFVEAALSRVCRILSPRCIRSGRRPFSASGPASDNPR